MADYTLRAIDDALWRRIKARAALNGQSIKSYILGLIKRDLERGES